MDLNMKDWKFPRLMKQSGLYFSEDNLLRLLEGFEVLGNWRHALSVVEWVYNENKYRYQKSRWSLFLTCCWAYGWIRMYMIVDWGSNNDKFLHFFFLLGFADMCIQSFWQFLVRGEVQVKLFVFLILCEYEFFSLFLKHHLVCSLIYVVSFIDRFTQFFSCILSFNI